MQIYIFLTFKIKAKSAKCSQTPIVIHIIVLLKNKQIEKINNVEGFQITSYRPLKQGKL